MEIFEVAEDHSANLKPALERLTWHAPVLTAASVGENTRNNVNQLPYDFTNVRS
ncbi:hypothetical protein [Sphingomonas sp.]|uniref:hypothetical protein n=1 Tax=Sphingomonas sp. TaxID=28214 RepID=UPI003B3A054A